MAQNQTPGHHSASGYCGAKALDRMWTTPQRPTSHYNKDELSPTDRWLTQNLQEDPWHNIHSIELRGQGVPAKQPKNRCWSNRAVKGD